MNIARNVIIVNTVININIVITVKINRIRNTSVNTNTIMYSHNACLLHIQMRTNSIEMYGGRRQRDCTILPYLHSKHFHYYKLNRTRYDSPL
jgi:hypothetical protein